MTTVTTEVLLFIQVLAERVHARRVAVACALIWLAAAVAVSYLGVEAA